ncbi:MAG: hypothetical protein JJU37_06070 [Balneolaceae bacterium]|nr:hypothetical protein [Balneolaceae bacterium]
MKLMKLVLSAVLVLIILTKCDTVSPDVAETETESELLTEITSPIDSSVNQSVEAKLKWKEIDGATSYQIMISKSKTFDKTIIDTTVPGTSFKARSLSQNTTYYWKIYPIKKNKKNSGPWSKVRSFKTDEVETASITKLSLLLPENNADKVSTNLKFSWKELKGVSKYEYQLSDNSSFNSVLQKKTVTGTSYKPSGLVHQKKYYWRVKIAGNENAWSEVRTFTTGFKNDIDNTGTPPPLPPPSSGSFVSTHNANFVLNGEILRFAGTNAYYLPNYEKLNPGVVDRALDLFQDTGITVVRMWGFYDGYDCGYSKNDSSENVIQTSPGVYSESALRDLDRVIAKGKDRGIKFIIPFVNYWDELGGVCQYNTWAGASNPSTNMDFFINNNQTQKWFKDYISMLLNRVNTVTGVAYKDEPAIFAWQIMNEGRNRGQHHNVMRNWYRDIARHIKSIDKNHLVSTGEEGFDEGTPSQYSVNQYSNTYALRANEGTSYIANTSIPEIDFGSAHWYPGEFGFGSTVNNNMLKAQRAWLSDHQKIAQNVGKPFYLGEFGLAGWGDNRVHQMYDALYKHAEEIKLDGNLLWQLVADGTKCWEFGGNICHPGGRADTRHYNKFKNHVTNMKRLK